MTAGTSSSSRQRREIAEEHKRLVEHVLAGIPSPAWTMCGVYAQHVVKGNDVTVAQSLYRLRVIADGGWIGAYLGLRKGDSKLHSSSNPHDPVSLLPGR